MPTESNVWKNRDIQSPSGYIYLGNRPLLERDLHNTGLGRQRVLLGLVERQRCDDRDPVKAELLPDAGSVVSKQRSLRPVL